MNKYILAIDAGTTSSRAILFDKNAEAVESISFAYDPFGNLKERLHKKMGTLIDELQLVYDNKTQGYKEAYLVPGGEHETTPFVAGYQAYIDKINQFILL